MSPTLPTNFNDTQGLMDYGKDLGITVGVGFFVPALVLSLLLIIVFIKFCGGKSDKREEFTNTARTVLIVAAVAILGVAVATCAVGWSYNKQCHDGIVGGTDTLQGVITSTSEVMLNVNLSVNDLKFNLLTEVNKTATIAANITTILTPLENILHVVDDARATLTNLSTLATTISNNITAVKRDLNNLRSLEADGVISGVPSANDVPNIDNTYTSALNTSVAELQSVTSLAHNLTNEVNDTLNYVANTVSDDLIDEVNDYSQRADEALSYFTDFHDQITDTNETFNEYSPKVVHYSSVRESVVAAILVLPLSLAILSLIGVVFRLELLLKISAAFCFAFMFWYFLLAGVNYAGYYTLDQFCQKQDEIVGNALSISNSDMQVPGTNVTIVVSEKVKLLLKCSGNTSLIDIFEFRFLVDQATGEINNLLRSVDNEVARLNQTDQYKKALDSLQSMENNSVSLDFLKNASLPTVHAGLNNVSQQLYNTINNPAYNSSLEAVNNITNNLLLTNSTTVHYYYGPSNITTLNCTQDPYDKLSQSVQQDLCTKAATAITLTNIRNRAIAESSAITGNITDINDRLYGFEASLPTVFTYQNRTSQYVTSIRGYLNDAYNRAMGLIRDVQRIIVNIADVIVDGASAISESTQCAYVGDAYSNLSGNVCHDISPSLQVITAMMVLGAAVFFFSTIVSMWTVYKIHRDS